MRKNGWGFDLENIDRSVRPQDDFFQYANGGWMMKAEIPKDEPRWGNYAQVNIETQRRLKLIVEALAKTKAKPGSPEQLLGDLYRSGLDLKRRDKQGFRPLEPYREDIKKVQTIPELITLAARFHVLGIPALWGAMIDQDAKKSDHYALYLCQDGLGLPDRDYYLSSHPEPVRVKSAYVPHIAHMLEATGTPTAEAVRRAEIIFSIEKKLARVSMKKEDLRDPYKTYHKFSRVKLLKLTRHISWDAYLKAIGARNVPQVIVMQPKFFKALDGLLQSVPLEDWKYYFEWHLLLSSAAHLSQRLAARNFEFYGRVLAGNERMRSLWRRVLGVVSGSAPEALGRIYIERYFTKEAKRAIDELITNIFASYQHRLKNVDWMSAATKKRALKKLSLMMRKIGYPSRWRKYKGLVVKPDDFFGNILRAAEFEHRRAMQKLKKPVDRTEWFMPPHMVNAYYNPGMNDIVFPAAILQFPFFDSRSDAAVNYGAIGAVIGHEITHGFDDEGSKFDGRGNLRRWWTKADRARFDKKGKIIRKQFDEYELHGVKVNGQLTLGENIADLGGNVIAFDAYQRHLEKEGRKIIDGFTPEQRFFLGMAQEWREITRPEFMKMIMLTDPHAPDAFRVNGPLSNMSEFYEAWNVKEGDKLFRAPKERAKIW